VTRGKPGEDLGIGWGVTEDAQTEAMGVNDARDLTDPDVSDRPDEPRRGQVDLGLEDDDAIAGRQEDRDQGR
jgi:hypothetical protein